MVLIIILFAASLTILICSYIWSNPNKPNEFSKRDCWFMTLASALGCFVAVVLFLSEIHPNEIKTKSLPQIDTLITYHSVDQTIDTTYFYTFKNE